MSIRYLAAARSQTDGKPTIFVWDLSQSTKPITHLRGTFTHVLDIRLFQNKRNTYVLGASLDGNASLWDIRKETPLQQFSYPGVRLQTTDVIRTDHSVHIIAAGNEKDTALLGYWRDVFSTPFAQTPRTPQVHTELASRTSVEKLRYYAPKKGYHYIALDDHLIYAVLNGNHVQYQTEPPGFVADYAISSANSLPCVLGVEKKTGILYTWDMEGNILSRCQLIDKHAYTVDQIHALEKSILVHSAQDGEVAQFSRETGTLESVIETDLHHSVRSKKKDTTLVISGTRDEHAQKSSVCLLNLKTKEKRYIDVTASCLVDCDAL